MEQTVLAILIYFLNFWNLDSLLVLFFSYKNIHKQTGLDNLLEKSIARV